MILTCPACGTKYSIADGALREKPRTVRCASCGHKWQQMPMATAIADEEEIPFHEDNEEVSATETSNEEFAAAEEPIYIPRSRPVPPPVKESSSSKGLTLAVLLIFLLSLITGTLIFKGKIVAAWAPAERFYEAVGFKKDVLGADLALKDVQSFSKMENNKITLKIKGEITNTGKKNRHVPLLKASLKGDEELLYSWIFSSGVTTLSAGASQKFEAVFDDAVDGGRNVLLTFTADNKKSEP